MWNAHRLTHQWMQKECEEIELFMIGSKIMVVNWALKKLWNEDKQCSSSSATMFKQSRMETKNFLAGGFISNCDKKHFGSSMDNPDDNFTFGDGIAKSTGTFNESQKMRMNVTLTMMVIVATEMVGLFLQMG